MLEMVGQSGSLTLEESSEPGPAHDEVVVRVEAAGVGLVDRLMLITSPEPLVPGIEVVGLAMRAGSEHGSALIGRRVFAMVNRGGYAEAVTARVDRTMPLPEDLSSADALAIGINGLVAHFALARAGLRNSERILIRGANSGIGIMGVQLAAEVGAEVTASRRNGNEAELRNLGAKNCRRRCSGHRGDRRRARSRRRAGHRSLYRPAASERTLYSYRRCSGHDI